MNVKLLIIIIGVLLLCTGMTLTISCSTLRTKSSLSRQAAIERSPQWRDGKFHNTLERNDSSIWSILERRFQGVEHTVPDEPVPVVVRTTDDFKSIPSSGLRVTWFGHSSVLIEIDGHRVLTDPVWSERISPVSFVGPKRFFDPPIPLEELPALSAVVISHDHFDHLDQATIQALKDRVPLFAVPLGVGSHLEEWGVYPEQIVELDWWEKVQVGSLTLTATPARHFSGRSLTTIFLNETLWCGWSIDGPVHRVYYSGDTAMFPGFTDIGDRLGPFDLTLIENGAYNELWADVHIGPEQAVRAHRMVRGKVMMPVHWATFDLAMHSWIEPAERLIAASDKSDISIVIPKPGESLEPNALPEVARWWPDLPWQRAEEAPVVSTGLAAMENNIEKLSYATSERRR
jgi:L-ascorbate metabolism protein UlaG (beta-lactamase superfamily)